jgi:hypothetical protein
LAEGGQSLPWGIYPGRCGSGIGVTIPLASAQTVPTLEMNASGKAEAEMEIGLTLPGAGSFHLNVFRARRPNELDAVLACANLRSDDP